MNLHTFIDHYTVALGVQLAGRRKSFIPHRVGG
jgi:hypothetical protein